MRPGGRLRRRLLLASAAAPAAATAGRMWRIDAVSRDVIGTLGGVSPPCAPTPNTSALTAMLLAEQQGSCNATFEVFNFQAPTVTVGACLDCRTADVIPGVLQPGYFCENGIADLCPGGFYCPSYLEKLPCPADTWCRPGFIAPQDCHELIECPEECCDEKAGKRKAGGWGALIGLVWFLCCGCTCCCCIRYRKAKEQKLHIKEAQKIVDDELILGEGFENDTPPVSIEFENMSMALKTNKKNILEGITGKFPASSLVALMGPSGGGKTTFMNALCGRASYGNVSGTIKINGREGGITDFPKLIGFVPQDDIMHPDLTVHQNLYYNAKLRLPATTTDEQREKHVNQVIKVLGLEHVAHSLVGDPENRGISGGQKKRVNIGMELVSMPAVIFMDEPTSGLDGAATIQLAQCLSRLRKSGLTIVCVIHQPRWAVYKEFTHLLLLGAGGKMVFCGEAPRVESYFLRHNFRLPERENPADWMIDIVCGLSPKYTGGEEDSPVDRAFTAPDDLFSLWDGKYKGRRNEWEGDGGGADPKALERDRVTPGCHVKTFTLLSRCARQWNRHNFVVSMVVLFFLGLIGGSITAQTFEFNYAAIKDTLGGSGLLFFMIVTVNSRGYFGPERLQYMREFKSGVSCTSYWFAKCVWGMIDMYMWSFAYALPLYWCSGIFEQDFGDFFNAYWLAAWYYMGFGMFITVFVPNPTSSMLICIFVPLLCELLFSGGEPITVEDSEFPSMLVCGRWFKQELFISEMKRYPANTMDFPQLQKAFRTMQSSLDEEGEGSLNLFILGLVFRALTWFCLLLVQETQGAGCCADVSYLCMKYISKAINNCFGVALCIPKAARRDKWGGRDIEVSPRAEEKRGRNPAGWFTASGVPLPSSGLATSGHLATSGLASVAPPIQPQEMEGKES